MTNAHVIDENSQQENRANKFMERVSGENQMRAGGGNEQKEGMDKKEWIKKEQKERKERNGKDWDEPGRTKRMFISPNRIRGFTCIVIAILADDVKLSADVMRPLSRLMDEYWHPRYHETSMHINVS